MRIGRGLGLFVLRYKDPRPVRIEGQLKNGGIRRNIMNDHVGAFLCPQWR